MAKKGQKFKKYSPEYDKQGGARQMLQRWERIFLEEGADYTIVNAILS